MYTVFNPATLPAGVSLSFIRQKTWSFGRYFVCFSLISPESRAWEGVSGLLVWEMLVWEMLSGSRSEGGKKTERHRKRRSPYKCALLFPLRRSLESSSTTSEKWTESASQKYLHESQGPEAFIHCHTSPVGWRSLPRVLASGCTYK